LTELEEWIRQEWGLDRIVFVTNEQFGTQTDLFQRFGFGREFKIRRPDAEGTYFGCGPQASQAKPMSIQPRSGLAPHSPGPRAEQAPDADRLRPMKSVAKPVPAFSIAAILALGACSSEATDAPEPESEPVQTLQVVERGFDQPEALAD